MERKKLALKKVFYSKVLGNQCYVGKAMKHPLFAILALDQNYSQLKIFFLQTREHHCDFTVSASLLSVTYKL